MKVAIFGGTGFVGSYIIDELIKNKHKPIVLVRNGSEHKLIQKDKCKFVTGDLNDHNAIEKIIKYRTIGDKTGNSEGIIISFIAALVNKSTSLP